MKHHKDGQAQAASEDARDGADVATTGASDRDEVVRQLRRRVDELESLFELAPVALAIGRDRECLVIDANPTFRRMLRLPADANASRSAPDGERPAHFRVLDPDGNEIPPHDLPMQRCARSGLPVNASECHVKFDDGTVIHLLGSSVPLYDEHARPRGCIGAFLDISARKAIEAEQARARGAAEAAARAKDRFLAVLSHELRGPLAPIFAVLTIWEADAATLPDWVREDMEMVRRNVAHLGRLVDDMMDVTGIAAGKLVVRPEPLDLHEVLRQCVDACRPACTEKGLALTYRPKAANARMKADGARLGQVFGNLLRNACKFTPRGSIDVSTEDLPAGPPRRGSSAPAPAVRVCVSDTGIGLDAGTSPDALFEPFEQGGDVRTQEYGGLGLGLAICRALVAAHGGRIGASSAGPGLGTTVTVDLPTDDTLRELGGGNRA